MLAFSYRLKHLRGKELSEICHRILNVTAECISHVTWTQATRQCLLVIRLIIMLYMCHFRWKLEVIPGYVRTNYCSESAVWATSLRSMVYLYQNSTSNIFVIFCTVLVIPWRTLYIERQVQRQFLHVDHNFTISHLVAD